MKMKMKSIFICLTLILFTGFVSAEVYVVSDPETEEVLSMSKHNDCVGATVDGEHKPLSELEVTVLPGTLTDYPIQNAPIYYYYRNNNFVLNVDKLSAAITAKEEFDKKKNFNTVKVLSDLYDEFGPAVAAQPFYGALSDFISNKDFTRMKSYAQALVSAEAVTQEQYNTFYGIIKNNGIDLLEY